MMLRHSEERFRLLYERSPLGYQSLDENGCLIEINPAWLELLGYSYDEVIGRWFGDFLAPFDQGLFRERFPRFKAAGETRGVQFEMIRKDGSGVVVEIDGKVGYNKEGNFKQTHCVLHERAEMMLRHSEERFRLLYERSPLGYQSLDENGCLIEINPAWLELLGYSYDEVIGRWFGDFLVPFDKGLFRERFPRFKAAGETRGVQFEMMRKDGSSLIVEIDGKIGYDEQGNFKQTHCVLHDITARKRAEEQLAVFRKFAQASEQALGMADLEGYITYANPTLCRVLGVQRPQDVCGTNIADYHLEQDLPMLQNEILPAVIEHGHQTLEMPLLSVDGKVTAVIQSIFLIRDDQDKPFRLANVITDITERKQAEDALRESEDRYRRVVEDQTEFIVRWQPNGVRTFVNDSYCRYFGKSHDELIGSSFFPLITEEDRERVIKRIEALTPESPVSTADHRVIRADGSTGWNQWTDRALFDEEGQLVEFQSVGRDITERKQAEDELRRHRDHLEEMVAARTSELETSNEELQREITERKRAEDLMRRQRDLALALNNARELDEGLGLCLDAAIEVSGMDSGGMYLFDDVTEDLDLIVHEGLSSDFVKSVSHYGRDSANANLVMKGNPVYTEHQNLRVFLDDTERGEGLGALAVLPVLHQGRVVGCLNVASHSLWEVPVWSGAALETIAAQIGSSIARLRAQKALEESEDKYRSLFEYAGDALFTMDFTEEGARFLDCNERTLKLFGCTRRDQIIGKIPEDFSPPTQPDGQPSNEKAFELATAVMEGRPQCFEWMHCRPDGTPFWVEVALTRIELDGRPLMQAIVRDITGRKEATEKLRQQKVFVENVLGSLTHPFYVIDANSYKVKMANPAAVGAFGAMTEGSTCYTLTHGLGKPCGGAEHLCPLEQVKKTKKAVTVEHIHHDKDGNAMIVEVHAYPVFDDEGNVVQVIEYCLDISKRKMVEEALRRERDFAQTLIDTTQAIILLLDSKGRISRFNPYMEQVSGYKLDEVQGKDWFTTFLPKRDQKRVRELFLRAREGVQTRGNINAIVTKDGREREIEWYDKTLEDADGKVVGVLATGQDITERKQIEQREREHQAQLAHASRLTTVGEMASSLAHELNQPLCAILTHAEGCSRMARSRAADDEEMLGKLDTIAAQAERAGEIVRRVRSFVRKEPPRQQIVHLGKIVRECLAFLKLKTQSHGVSVELDLDEGIPAVFADTVQIEQVVLNLARNGIEAMQDPEILDRRLTIRNSKRADGWVEVAVRDTGKGLPKKELDKVFEPFFTTKADGLGIGLSVSRSIVESHGGRLYARANPDGGMTFSFSIPAATALQAGKDNPRRQ
jgi:PAS domain S-box-containing protein